MKDTAMRWRNGLASSTKFQSWANRMPLLRRFARRDGERLFDLVAGFVYSQTLLACIELDIFERLRSRPLSAGVLAAQTGLDAGRMKALCQAAAALGLLESVRYREYGLGRLGAALLGVPGLSEMIRHHRKFYRDLEDPVAFLRGEGDTELARFWPYVLDGGGPNASEAQEYSNLMAQSQALVAEETLSAVSLEGASHLMDVGGGAGAFLCTVGRQRPNLELTLFDLPAVERSAKAHVATNGLAERINFSAGSFLDDALPRGADAISLVRVLYDHCDAVAKKLLACVNEALPLGGMVLISEPMSGGGAPTPAGDAYFAFYTLAMRSGRVRTPKEISEFLLGAGFGDVRVRRMSRPFITQAITARKIGNAKSQC